VIGLLGRGTGRAALDASGEAVERDLGHHGNDPRVVGRDRDGVRSTEGVAPQRHPVGVEVGTSPDPGDGGSDVLVLTRDVDELAWLAAALTEAAVIEDERDDPAGGEPFGIGDQPVHRSASRLTILTSLVMSLVVLGTGRHVLPSDLRTPHRTRSPPTPCGDDLDVGQLEPGGVGAADDVHAVGGQRRAELGRHDRAAAAQPGAG
jgi:hypothetical protein